MLLKLSEAGPPVSFDLGVDTGRKFNSRFGPAAARPQPYKGPPATVRDRVTLVLKKNPNLSKSYVSTGPGSTLRDALNGTILDFFWF